MGKIPAGASWLGLIVVGWLVYLAIEVAKHVHAWPFG